MWKARKWVGIAALLIGFAAWGADVADRLGFIALKTWAFYPNTGQVTWNFEETAAGHGYFLNMQKFDNKELSVVGFGAHGKNNSADPIDDFRAFLRSDVTNETVPLYIMAIASGAVNACTVAAPTLPINTRGIPGFADFDVVSYERPWAINVFNEDGIPYGKFLRTFVPFTVVTKYDGKTYTRQFSLSDVQTQVAILEKVANPPTVPHVIRKENTPSPRLPKLTPLFTPRPPIAPEESDVTGTIPKQ